MGKDFSEALPRRARNERAWSLEELLRQPRRSDALTEDPIEKAKLLAVKLQEFGIHWERVLGEISKFHTVMFSSRDLAESLANATGQGR